MIMFDLRCAHAHVFEAWFASSAAFEEQRAAGLVACPVCGDRVVEKAVMAPNVAAKGNRAVARAPSPATPAAAMKAALAAIAQAQAEALDGSEWVGARFAERARAMHDGLEPVNAIHGQATREQARELIEDGVPVTPLIVPVVPPEARN